MTADVWFYVVIALVVAIAVAWWALVATRKTRIEREAAAAEETAARRNQALIDAPRLAAEVEVPPPTPEGLAGVGVAVAASAEPVPEQIPVAADDLRRIKGVGPKLATLLNSLGVTSYTQIAAWDEADIDRIDSQLGAFQGRISRDDWPAQARLLAAGDKAGFEARFGKL